MKYRHAALVIGLMAGFCSGAAKADAATDEVKKMVEALTAKMDALTTKIDEMPEGTGDDGVINVDKNAFTSVECIERGLTRPAELTLPPYKSALKTVSGEVVLRAQQKSVLESESAFKTRLKLAVEAGTTSEETRKKELSADIGCARRLFKDAGFLAAELPAVPTNNVEAADQTTFEEIKELYAGIAHQDVYRRPQATLLLGPSLVLRGDGQFRGGVETTLLFDGGAESLFGFGRTFTDISFQSRGQLGTQPIAEDAEAGDLLTTQFSSDKGYFRFNTGVSTQIDNRVSFALSGGLNAVPREGQEFAESLRERYTATIVTRTFLSQGIYTRFAIGGAYDKSWRYFNAVPETTPPTMVTPADQRESYGRAIVNMELFLPQANGIVGGISGAARLSLDTPINGDGPSEVRLSILAYLDFRDFFKALNPLYK